MGRDSTRDHRSPSTPARLWHAVRRAFGWPTSPNHRKKRRHRIKTRAGSPELNFNLGGTWAWSLRIYEGSTLYSEMQAASPLTCLTVVAPFFEDDGEPKPPFTVHIRCNSNRRQLKLDHHSYSRIGNHAARKDDTEIINYLARHFDRDAGLLGDSACVTVMTDNQGEVVDSTAVLGRVFGSSPSPVSS